MINKYNDFILDKLIQESILYFSPELRKKLRKVNLDISKELLKMETENIKDDITFINVDTDGYVSYNTMRNAIKAIKDRYPTLIDTIERDKNRSLADEFFLFDTTEGNDKVGIYDSKSRGRIGFGRLINRIFPGKFTPGQIEEFTNKWKSILENKGEKIELVEGNDIANWYKQENYKELKSTLGNSCMRNNKESTFKIYTLNPEVCRMVIITDEGELVARAIVWKVAEKSTGDWQYFMDRQYAISDDYIEKLRNYALTQGWSYKTNNNHTSFSNVSWRVSEDTIKSQSGVRMSLQLKPYLEEGNYDYRNYPYLDTFRRYDPNTGWLFNDDDKVEGSYLLDSTSGGYSECETGVYSEWHDQTIPEDEAIWSDAVDSYLWQDRAVEVRVGSRRYRGWYPEDYDNIVFDEWNNEYIHINDAVHSDRYGYYILAEDSASAIYKLDSDGEPNRDESYINENDVKYIEISDLTDLLWYQKLSAQFKTWEDGYTHTMISKSLLTTDWEGNWIPKMYQMSVYKVVDRDLWLDQFDAQILDLEINLERPVQVDKFRYNEDIKSYYPEILNKSKQKLEQLKSEDSETAKLQNSLVQRIEEIEDKTWADWEEPE